MTPLPVFADVDTGVDDALALLYLLASPEVTLVGIGCTDGNVAVDRVCANTLGLLRLCGRSDIPVSAGAGAPLRAAARRPGKVHGPNGLGYAELPAGYRELTGHDAATAWLRAARAHPGELIAVATGPLTNLALALRAEPALPTLVRRLVIMGGAYDHRGNTTPVAEFNVGADPEAAAEVLDGWSGGPPPVLCGLDLTRRVALTPQILAGLAAAAGSATPAMSVHDERGTRSAAANPLIRVIEDAIRCYFEVHDDLGYGYLAHLHDPLAAAAALDPQLVGTRPATVAVELAGTLTRGMTVTDWAGRWGREPNALIGVDVDPAVFFDRFVERVAGLARQVFPPRV